MFIIIIFKFQIRNTDIRRKIFEYNIFFKFEKRCIYSLLFPEILISIGTFYIIILYNILIIN